MALSGLTVRPQAGDVWRTAHTHPSAVLPDAERATCWVGDSGSGAAPSPDSARRRGAARRARMLRGVLGLVTDYTGVVWDRGTVRAAAVGKSGRR